MADLFVLPTILNDLQAIVFLELFCEQNKEKLILDDLPTMEERNYLAQSKEELNSYFVDKLSIKCQTQNDSRFNNNETNKDYYYFVRVSRDDQQQHVVTLEQLKQLLTNLKRKYGRNAFDYPKLAQQILKTTSELFAEYLPTEVTEKLQEIEINAVVPTGEEWSIDFEVGFGAGGKEIAYPNANLFSPDHIKQALERGYTRSEENLYIDYFFWCIIANVHEYCHIIQQFKKQEDDSGWILEHDASRLQLIASSRVLLAAFGKENEKERCNKYVNQFMELAVIHHAQIINKLKTKFEMTEEFENKYKEWRDTFGTIAPQDVGTFEYNMTNTSETIYMKQRIALDAYQSFDMNHFNELMDFMFSRTGKLKTVTQLDTIPNLLKI